MVRCLKTLFVKSIKIMFGLGIVSLVFGAFVQVVWSATYYMPDDFANLQAAMSGMSGGDELVIRDGTYTGSLNSIDNYHLPPSGSSGAYTIIRAENPGEVTFDGQGVNNMVYVDGPIRSYIILHGLSWCRSNASNLFYIGNWNHIKVQRCGFYDSGINASDSRNAAQFRDGSYLLFEDCYVYGEFYYGLIYLECEYSIMRRCVVRKDIGRGPRQSGITIYSSQNIEIQNCIVIDSDQTAHYTGITEFFYGLNYPNTNGGFNGCHTRDTIVLNLRGMAGSTDDSSLNQQFTNVVFWDTDKGFYDRKNDPSTYNNCLFGMNKPSSGWGAAIGGHYYRNSIMTDNTTWGWENGAPNLNYNCFYHNSPNYSNPSYRGTHDYATENGNEINPYNNSLKYLVRIESGSDLVNAGENGGRVGPEILLQLGKTGSLWGDSGWNTYSGQSLWPFPHEDIIRDKMRAYSRDGINGSRGFCVDSQTLTKYIWEYLGNTIPTEIYGNTTTLQESDVTPPGISNITVSSIDTDSAIINWATSEQATGLVEYGITTAYGSNTAQTSLGTSHQVVLSGLNSGTTYNFKITCEDNSNNSSTSSNLTFSTLVETTSDNSGDGSEDNATKTLQNFEDGIIWVPGGAQDPTGNGRGWAFLDAGSNASIEIDNSIGANNTQSSLKITFDSDDPQIYFRSNDKTTDHMPEAAGANRMSFYVRFPEGFPIQPLPFRYDTWQLGTFIHDPDDWSDTYGATYEDDHGIHHYYHRLTIEKAGNGWVKYIVTTQPDQANYSGSTVPPNIEHYFNSFGRFYFHFGPEAGGPTVSSPFTIWIDEIKFYHDDGSVGGQVHVGGQDDDGFDGEYIADSENSTSVGQVQGVVIVK